MNNVANQQQQISSSGNQVLGSSEARDDCIINGENIGQEPDDTFKIDEQQTNRATIISNALMGQSQQESRNVQNSAHDGVSRKSDQIENMQQQQDYLKK